MSRSSDLVRFTLMAKLSSTKKTAILPSGAQRARLQPQHLVHDALVGAKADRVAEETGHGAEVASVGAAAAGFDGDDVEGLPRPPEVPHDRAKEPGDPVELVDIERLPGDRGIVLQRRLVLLPECVHRCVDLPSAGRRAASSTIRGHVSSASPRAMASAWRGPPSRPSASSGASVTCGPPITTGTPAARTASATRYALAIMRVMAPIPTSPIFSVEHVPAPGRHRSSAACCHRSAAPRAPEE